MLRLGVKQWFVAVPSGLFTVSTSRNDLANRTLLAGEVWPSADFFKIIQSNRYRRPYHSGSCRRDKIEAHRAMESHVEERENLLRSRYLVCRRVLLLTPRPPPWYTVVDGRGGHGTPWNEQTDEPAREAARRLCGCCVKDEREREKRGGRRG